MRPTAFQPQSCRQRALSLVLALSIVALLLLALLTLAPRPDLVPSSRDLATFSVSPDPTRQAAERRAAPRTVARQKQAPPAARIVTPKPIVPPPVKVAGGLPGVIAMDLDANDIGKIKGTATAAGGDGDTGTDSVAAYGPGEGPGGQPLYDAEWYREPTNAELNGYLPRGAPPDSWALIACKTVPDYRVDNCRQLGESPLGSGLARAMRQAAWQFRVRPPRIGGKPIMGAWVRIRITFSEVGASVRR